MKLISCHVENYGALVNVNYDFKNGLNPIIKENGAGKTTLASFIRAMLYGLPSTKANSAVFNDRERFYPFGGGKFGGNLTFEANGNIYKTERFFDKKSAVKDELKIYENGREIKLGEELGKVVFGLDEKTFSRTVFFGSDGSELFDGTGVKLANFVDDTDGEISYEEAFNALTDARKKYKALRGDAGVIKDLKNKKRETEEKIESLERLEKSVGAMYSEKKLREEKIFELNQRYENAVNFETIKAKRANLDKAVAEVNSNKYRLDEIRKKYPCGIPSRGEIDEINYKLTDLAAKKNALVNEKLTAEQEYKLNILEKEFRDGELRENELIEIRRRVESAVQKNAVIKQLNDEIKDVNADPIAIKFDNSPVDGDEYERAMNELNEFREAEEKRRVLSDGGASVVPIGKKKSGAKRVFVSIGILSVIVGVCLMFVNMYAGIVLTAFGVITAIMSLAGFKPKKGDVTKEYAELTAKCNLLKNSVAEFTVKHGYSSRDGVFVSFSKLTDDLERYAAILEKREIKTAERDKLAREKQDEEADLNKLFSYYGINESLLSEAADKLSEKCRTLTLLREERITRRRNAEKLGEEITDIQNFVTRFIEAYKFQGRDLKTFAGEIADDRAEAESLKRRNAALEQEIAGYRSVSDDIETRETATKEELYNELKAETNRLAALKSEITIDEASLEELPDAKSLLDGINEELSSAEEKYSVICYAQEFLEKAERKLRDEYVAPVRGAFEKYASVIEKALGENVEMDKDFNVSFERNGELHSEKHFSAGQRAVIDLCLRLAIADNVFKNENPFIILDDPFVALDEEHLSKTKSVLADLAESRQILYFTCHHSRML